MDELGGGTGVVTIGALPGMAAHMEGKGCGIIDMAGLALKGGAVVSHIKIAASPDDIKAIRIATGGADLILGGDMVVAAGADMLASLSKDRGAVVVNSHQMMTMDFVSQPDFKLPVNAMRERIRRAVPEGRSTFVDASDIAVQVIGDSIASNAFLLGVAYQKGLIPVEAASILRAIELNGVAVDLNVLAFMKGRQWVHSPAMIEVDLASKVAPVSEMSLEALIADRVDHLTAYKSRRYAKRFERLVDRVSAVDRDPGQGLTRVVAHNLARVMAYKDEYEAARLYADGRFAARVEEMFEGDYSLTFHLAPPLTSKVDPATGVTAKTEYGAWMMKAFGLLARLKGLRSTPFDILGYSQERKAERGLIKEYEVLVDQLIQAYEGFDYDVAIEMARLPEIARGFGHVKERNLEEMRARKEELGLRLKINVGAKADAA